MAEVNGQENDDIQLLLRGLYYEVMGLRFEYMKRKRKGEKEIADVKEKIDELDETFKSLAKTHTVFLRLEKANGVKQPKHSIEVLQKIAEIRANVGQIVSMIPK